MTISTDDVRRLLQADDHDAVLVLVEGRTEVIGAAALASEKYRGALEVISREDLLGRVGADVSERVLTEQASILDSAVSELGG